MKKAPSTNKVKGQTETVKVEREVCLRKTIGFTAACAIIMSNIGGSSIFIAPTTVLTYAGSQGMALAIWVLGGLIQMGMAAAIIELALMFPKAGGVYFYVHQTFGKLLAFIMLWGFIIFISSTGWALASYSCSLYILSLISTDCSTSDTDSLVVLLATIIVLFFIALNCTYTRLVTQVQKVLTSSKLITMLIIIVVGFLHISSETGQENLNNLMEGSHSNVGKLAMGLFAGYYSFGGVQIITLLTEEVKKPEKVLPRSIVTSFLTVITLCVATIFSYGVVLSKAQMLKSDAIAVQFGHMVHPALVLTLTVLINLCNISVLNTMVMGQPRMLYAGGVNGQMPKMMKLLHRKFKTPWPATFTTGLLALVQLQYGNITSMVDNMSLYAGFINVMVMLCVIYLRWKCPHIHRPIRLPLIVPIVFLLLTITLMVLSVMTKPAELGIVIAIVALAIPVYYVCIVWQKPERLFRLVDVFTRYLQLFLDLE